MDADDAKDDDIALHLDATVAAIYQADRRDTLRYLVMNRRTGARIGGDPGLALLGQARADDTPSYVDRRLGHDDVRVVTYPHSSPMGPIVVLVAAFTLVLSRELLEDDGPRATLLNAHRWAGLLVGGLTLGRAINRWRSTLANTIGHCPLWQRWMAHGLHGALYVALLALPLLGWALTNARGHAVPLPLGLALPNLIGKDLDLADTLEDAHAYLAWGLAAATPFPVTPVRLAKIARPATSAALARN